MVDTTFSTFSVGSGTVMVKHRFNIGVSVSIVKSGSLIIAPWLISFKNASAFFPDDYPLHMDKE